jgi:uncharacterized protein (TIGR01777 family)
MRVAIVGGSGLLGRHIAAALRARDDDVLILSRDPDRARRKGVSDAVAAWVPGDPAGLASAIHGADAVVNLAGVAVGPRPWTRRRRQAILDSRVIATRTVARAIAVLPAAARPTVLVNASGTDAYTGRDSVAATESTPPSAGFLARVCLAWEAEANRARASGTRVVVLRIGFVLAPGATALRLLAVPFRLGLGGPIGNGRQWMSWIHLDDLVGLVLFALDDPRVDGIVNAVGPVPARQSDVAAAIGAALGRPSWLRVPATAVQLAMHDQSTLVLGSRRIVPARAVELGFPFSWRDLRTAMADALGR